MPRSHIPSTLRRQVEPATIVQTLPAAQTSEEVCFMTAVATSTTASITLADLLEQLGDIAPARVRFRPVPGTATETDVLAIHDREDRLYELVDCVLVEKAMGFRESLLAGMLIEILRGFVRA